MDNELNKIIDDLRKLQEKYGSDIVITMCAVFIRDLNNGAWEKIKEEFE